jgi:hypothetical protein
MLNNSKYFVMNFFLLDEHEKYSANETSLVSQAISEISKSSKERLFNIVSCEDEADIIVLLESRI